MKKRLSFLACLALMMGLLGIWASADTEEPLLVDISFSAKKDTYDAGDTIKASLEIKNNYDYPLSNLTVLLDAPEGYRVENPEDLPDSSGLAAGKKASCSVNLIPETAKEGFPWGIFWLVAGIVIVGIAVIAVIVILILRKKLKAKAVVSMLLVSITLAGMATMWVQADAAEVARHSITREISLTLGGKPQTITATISFDTNPLADEVTLDTSRMGYSQLQSAYTTTMDFDGFHGTLKNPRAYSEIYLKVYDGQDHLLQKQSTAAAKQWHFNEVGLCPGVNRIRITIVGNNTLTLQFDLLDFYGNTFHLLEGYEADTDEDGIPDLVEISTGTDPENADTDGDGLLDNDELNLGLDPTKVDTDGNGTPDGQEDYDNDGISNTDELKKGLSSILADTDGDGIDDNDELKKYKTDPLKTDSDDDGAPDGWELENGYKPGKEDKTFSLSAQTASVSELNPVSAAVSLTINGKEADVESLEISSVSVADNPQITNCIAGYLGPAYDFTLDGAFDSAILTFRYDPALGQPGENFDPRICYFNPDTNNFEPLPDQTVKDGVVTAKTTHFSIYSLLNWSKMKETLTTAYNDFKQGYATGKEEALEALATADIAIVMDNSASMAWNDPANKSKEVAHYFIDHIREKYDNVSLMSYTYTNRLVQPLTSDKDTLHKAVDSIALDNGINITSGTNGFAAINAAIDSLRGGGGAYRYILFFSDGDDKILEKNYSSAIARANGAGVKLLTVGIHTTGSSYLKTLAHETSGQYYILDENLDVEKAFGHALSVFDAITPTEEDSNNDGISDYITTMIYEGKITLPNGDRRLMGTDFNVDANGNPSADWDGDGLKNGEELHLHYNPIKKTVYMNMSSHPCLSDSDGDFYSDTDENKNNMDPFAPGVETKPVDYLMSNSFCYEEVITKYDPNSNISGFNRWWNTAILNINSNLYAGGSFTRDEIYYELLAQYFLDHGKFVSGTAQAIAERKLFLNLFDSLQSALLSADPDIAAEVVSKLSDGTKKANSVFTPLDASKKLYQLQLELIAWKADPKTAWEIDVSTADFIDEMTDLMAKSKIKIPVKWSGTDSAKKFIAKASKYADKVDTVSKNLGTVGDILTITGSVVDVVYNFKMLSDIEKQSAIFLENLEILELIASNRDNEYAAYAADKLIVLVCTEFWGTMLVGFEELLREVCQLAWSLIPKLLECVPVVGVIVGLLDIGFNILNWLTQNGAEVESVFKLLCYNEMDTAYTIQLAGLTTTNSGKNEYYVDEKDAEKFYFYLIHLAQIRMLAENEYITYCKVEDGLLSSKTYNSKKDSIANSISNIENALIGISSGKIFHPTSIGGGGGHSFGNRGGSGSGGMGGGGGHGKGR